MDRTIFIVEDNDGVATLLRELCVELGVQSVHTRAGSEALAKLRSMTAGTGGRWPDIIVLDLALAELDGFQVATTVREMPGGGTVPIVVISGVYKRLPEAFEARVQAVFLPKPFPPAAIRRTLQEFLDTADRALGLERGRFVKTNPSELFVRLCDRRASGLLEVSTQETKRRLWWQGGQIRFGQSNVRTETAGAMQVQKGELAQAAFDSAMAHARQARVPLYEALTATRALSPAQTTAALKLQTQEVAIGVLSMAGADWMLTQTDLAKVPDAGCHPLELIIQSAGRLLNPEDAKEALLRLGEVKEALQRSGEVSISRSGLLDRELVAVRKAWPDESVTKLVAGPTPLVDLMSKLPDRDAPFLWALATSGLLKTETSGGSARTGTGLAPVSIESLAVETPAKGAGVKGGGIKGAGITAADRTARQFILAEKTRTADLDSYRLLGVSRTATTEEIRQAFLGLAREYHSDTYAGLNLGDAGPALADLFQRLSSAHEALTDANRRAEYDIFLTRKADGLPTDVATVLQAEELFKKAELLLKTNAKARASYALELLDQAIQLNPGDPEFHIYRAYAAFRWRAPSARAASAAREAIAQALQRAPNLGSAYVFLGLIARDMGADADAVLHFEKALSLDPKDDFAMREVRAARHKLGKSPDGSIFKRLFRK